eukprot:TRINITY_DN42201_c0_g1_i1.p1 TRINITY_DN42201_c0_g1~~TRINITY_DN42201_c0_g1_i1.p1  ORF type:complete len:846 (+),score=102.52 TRINITY_DN42201_c0_g1_i1:54-2591(+)
MVASPSAMLTTQLIYDKILSLGFLFGIEDGLARSLRLVCKGANRSLSVSIAGIAASDPKREVLRVRVNEGNEAYAFCDIHARLVDEGVASEIRFASSRFPGSGSLVVVVPRHSANRVIRSLGEVGSLISLERVIAVACLPTHGAKGVVAKLGRKLVVSELNSHSASFRVTGRRYLERKTDIDSIECAQLLGGLLAEAHGAQVSLNSYDVEVLASIYEHVLVVSISVHLPEFQGRGGDWDSFGVALAMLKHLEGPLQQMKDGAGTIRLVDPFCTGNMTILREAHRKFPTLELHGWMLDHAALTLAEQHASSQSRPARLRAKWPPEPEQEGFTFAVARPVPPKGTVKAADLQQWYVEWLLAVGKAVKPGGLVVVLVTASHILAKALAKIKFLLDVKCIKMVHIYSSSVSWSRIFVLERVQVQIDQEWLGGDDTCDKIEGTRPKTTEETPQVANVRIQMLRAKVLSQMVRAANGSINLAIAEELLAKVIFSLSTLVTVPATGPLDPVIPSHDPAVVQELFERHILAQNVDTVTSHRLAGEWTNSCLEAATQVQRCASRNEFEEGWCDESMDVAVELLPWGKNTSPNAGRYASLKFRGREVCKLDETRFNTLVASYSSGHDDVNTHGMLTRMVVMVQRYQSVMLGSRCLGMHAALPSGVFDLLRERFGCSTECFASPLNHTLPAYCSLFPITDRFFGSLGQSFFEFWPVQGSFQCNPVFSVDVADRMFTHIASVLRSSSLNLTFIVFIPTTLCEKTLSRSPFVEGGKSRSFMRRQLEVPLGEHAYVPGEQHALFRGDRPLNRAEFETMVIFLQNDAGMAAHPASDAAVAALLHAWKMQAERPLLDVHSV